MSILKAFDGIFIWKSHEITFDSLRRLFVHECKGEVEDEGRSSWKPMVFESVNFRTTKEGGSNDDEDGRCKDDFELFFIVRSGL